jgi:hypothetical protein
MIKTNAKTQRPINDNSSKFAHMSNQDIGRVIIKGRAGSERSKHAILELARRHRVLKNELMYLGVFPQHSETKSNQLWNGRVPNQLNSASYPRVTGGGTTSRKYNFRLTGILSSIFTGIFIGLYTASLKGFVNVLNMTVCIIAFIFVVACIAAIISLFKN